jgi:hypothetical protein
VVHFGACTTPLHAINTNENLIGLVNGNGVSIHHVADRALICRVAFILGERGRSWLIVGFRLRKTHRERVPA